MADLGDLDHWDVWFASEAIGIALLDRDLRYRRVNERLARLHGLPAAEHVGRTVEEVVGREHADRLLPLARRALAGERLLRQRYEEQPRQVVLDLLPLSDGLLVLAVDTTQRRRTESALAVRLQMAELLSELSASFIELPAARVDEGIEEALSVAGVALGVERAALWRYDPQRTRIVISHQWSAPGLESQLGSFSFPLDQSGYFAQRFLAGQSIALRSLDELPADAADTRRMLESLGTRALAAVPFVIAGELRGAVSFSHVHREREWSPEVIAALRLASEIFANALDRQRSDAELRGQLAFERAYRRISAQLNAASTENLSASLGKAFAIVGEDLGFARIALSTYDSLSDVPQILCEWQAPGLKRYSELRTKLDRVEQVGWPMPQMTAGELVIASLDEIPADAVHVRATMAGGPRLLAVAPLQVASRTAGALILHALEEPAYGRVELAGRLRLLAELFGATLIRVRTEAEQRRTLEELSRLKSTIEAERDYLRQEVKGEPGRRELLGSSPALRRALDAVDAVAATNATALLLGESGVGKELFARAVHERSRRADGPLVKVNCASIPKELFESEFFGHVRGAFTGAHKDRAGRFELAHRGTLFLDEVGEIPLELQSKLLRVLQEGELERVGDDRTRRVDVRIVAATNRNLQRDVAAGTFRQDLYYRLSVFPIQIPPLRDRREDIPLLAEHFLSLFRRTFGRPELAFTPQQLQVLSAYAWPGNVRELQHVIERSVILAGQSAPLLLDLETHTQAAVPTAPTPMPPSAPPSIMTEGDLQELSRRSVLAALERTSWRIGGTGGAAELLGLRPSTLRDRMRALKIERPR